MEGRHKKSDFSEQLHLSDRLIYAEIIHHNQGQGRKNKHYGIVEYIIIYILLHIWVRNYSTEGGETVDNSML